MDGADGGTAGPEPFGSGEEEPPLAFHSRIRTGVALLAVSLGFVAFSLALLITGEGTVPPWYVLQWIPPVAWDVLGIVFFGGCSVVFARQLASRRPRLEAGPDGIRDRTRPGAETFIPWEQIQAFHRRRRDVLDVRLRDPEAWIEAQPEGRQKAMRRALERGRTPCTLWLRQLDRPPEAVAEALEDRLALRLLGEIRRARALTPGEGPPEEES